MPATVLDFGSAITAPQRPFCESQGISLSLLTALLRRGEVDSVIVGGRHRHVVLGSWREYIHRQLAGLRRDPAEREAAATRYRNSVSPAATLAAKRALAAKPRPGRPPGSGKGHGRPNPPARAAAPAALPARMSSPPSAEAPKKTSTARRSARKESIALM
jgi:hypothetical protein